MAISSTEVYDQDRGQRRIDTDFFGTRIETTVTSTPAVIHQWIHCYGTLYRNYYPKPLVVGINVQFYRTQSVDKADTLQLCIGTHCLLIHLSHTPYVPGILRLFLLDPNIRWDLESF
ncbi:hypothetical protein C5167_016088 [Papaver somniferum]|nr:hypothetical protein C5167_016088 [Papaver somniferum]